MVVSFSCAGIISPRPLKRPISGFLPLNTVPSSSSSKATAILSASTLAGDLPIAIMMRPQLGSWPLIAVFTRGEFATLRATTTASRRVRAPRTATVTSLVAPSPSSTSMRARRVVTAPSARVN